MTSRLRPTVLHRRSIPTRESTLAYRRFHARMELRKWRSRPVSQAKSPIDSAFGRGKSASSGRIGARRNLAPGERLRRGMRDSERFRLIEGHGRTLLNRNLGPKQGRLKRSGLTVTYGGRETSVRRNAALGCWLGGKRLQLCFQTQIVRRRRRLVPGRGRSDTTTAFGGAGADRRRCIGLDHFEEAGFAVGAAPAA